MRRVCAELHSTASPASLRSVDVKLSALLLIANLKLVDVTKKMAGTSNAAVACVKLLLTVFNFVFWVSHEYSLGLGLRVDCRVVVPYVAAFQCLDLSIVSFVCRSAKWVN